MCVCVSESIGSSENDENIRGFEYHQLVDDNLIFSFDFNRLPPFESLNMYAPCKIIVGWIAQDWKEEKKQNQAPQRFLFERDKYSINQMCKYHIFDVIFFLISFCIVFFFSLFISLRALARTHKQSKCAESLNFQWVFNSLLLLRLLHFFFFSFSFISLVLKV